MMNRNVFINRWPRVGAAHIGASPPAAVAQTKWNLPAAYPADNPHSENLVAFAKDVEAATAASSPSPSTPTPRCSRRPRSSARSQSGQAQMGEVLMSIHENEDPIFGIDVVPFLATSFRRLDEALQSLEAGGREEARRAGLKLLFMVPWAPQGVYAKKDINTIEDMKGLKWRSYNVGTARLGELLGMQSVTIQAAELPQALATGVVNSFMSSGGTGYDSARLGIADAFLRRPGLDPEGRDLRQQGRLRCPRQADPGSDPQGRSDRRERGWKMWQDKAGWYLEQLKAKGMKVQAPSPALAAGFKKAGETLTADWLKKAGADGQAIVDAYKKM
jgi:TRAP-type C4-dicarboxylate transport system substrate-binding protein